MDATAIVYAAPWERWASYFSPGLYAYVGSAQRHRRARVARHLRLEKTKRWHIDYLRPAAEVVAVTYCNGDRADECRLVDHLIKRFGADAGLSSFWRERLPLRRSLAADSRRDALLCHEGNRLALRHVFHGD